MKLNLKKLRKNRLIAQIKKGVLKMTSLRETTGSGLRWLNTESGEKIRGNRLRKGHVPLLRKSVKGGGGSEGNLIKATTAHNNREATRFRWQGVRTCVITSTIPHKKRALPANAKNINPMKGGLIYEKGARTWDRVAQVWTGIQWVSVGQKEEDRRAGKYDGGSGFQVNKNREDGCVLLID